MKSFRNFALDSPLFGPFLTKTALLDSDSVLSLIVTVHSILMIIAGALVMAGMRVGGALTSISMLLLILFRDNPLLGNSETSQKINFMNMLKDLAVVAAGILVLMKKTKIVHRK